MSEARGSAYYEAGSTKVFCAVNGPYPQPTSVEGNILCEVRWASFSGESMAANENETTTGGMTNLERELSAGLSRTMAATVRLDRYPKARIDLSAFVLEDDGAAYVAIVSVAAMALADAGIEMRDLVCAASAAIIRGSIVLDPCTAEEKEAEGSVLVAYQPTFGKVTDVIQTGEMDIGTVTEALKVCAESAVQISQLMRKALKKDATKLLKKTKK